MNFDYISVPYIVKDYPIFRYKNGRHTFDPESSLYGGVRVPDSYISFYSVDVENFNFSDRVILKKENMSYNKSNGFAPYPAGYFPQNQSYYDNFNGVTVNNRTPGKKKSGAKEVRGVTKDGVEYFGVKAWFYRRNTGLVSIIAFQNKNSTPFNTDNGGSGISLMFEVFYRNSGIKRLCVASYFFDSGKAYLKELGLMVSTKANNGGYAGFIPSEQVKRQYRRR